MFTITAVTQPASSVLLRTLMHHAKSSYYTAAIHRLPESSVHCSCRVEGGNECQMELSLLYAFFQWGYQLDTDTPLVRVRGCQGLPIVPTGGQG